MRYVVELQKKGSRTMWPVVPSTTQSDFSSMKAARTFAILVLDNEPWGAVAYISEKGSTMTEQSLEYQQIRGRRTLVIE